MDIGRRIYFDITTGNIILDTGERSGHVIETTTEHDYASYVSLSERNPETVGMLQLEFGELQSDFMACNGYRINPDTMEIEFSYPDPGEQEPVYQKPLSLEISELKEENINLMLALTQVYEEKELEKAAMQEESINNMLAITELYEMIIGGN